MNAESTERPLRSWRSIFLPILTSIAFIGASFAAPAKALDSVPADDSWQAAAEAASATPAELKAEVADGSLNLVVVRDIDGAPSIESIHLSTLKQLEFKLLDLSKDPSVVAVDEDIKVRVDQIVSNSTYYAQWSLPAISAGGTSSEGSGVVVAVVDSGVESGHQDLQGRVLDGADFVQSFDSSCDLSTDLNHGKVDPNGHGTHVAGIIAASGIGVRGVAPGVSILPIRVIGNSGTGTSSDVACGINYAVDNGAKVINLSLGSDERSSAISAAVARAHDFGITVIAAAGNNAQDCTKTVRNLQNYPAAEANVIAVGAIEPNGEHAGYSTWGPQVDIAAPGSSIISTYKGNSYAYSSGTSMAAPHVTAVAAIILSHHPEFTPEQVLNRLISTAFNPTNVYSEEYGFGIVSASAAISGTRATAQEVFLGNRPSNLGVPACILAEIDQAAKDKAAADKAAADKLAADQAAAEADRVAASLPVVQQSLVVRPLNKKRIAITVAAPAGSKTLLQRKIGKKWRSVVSTTTVPSMVVKVSKSGTYRVRIEIPTGTITTKSYKVK